LIFNRNHPSYDSKPLFARHLFLDRRVKTESAKNRCPFFSHQAEKKGIAHDRMKNCFQASGAKSALDAPHTGHSQLSGTFAKGVPAATPLSGSP
jgi:hypothetical protein